MFPHGLEQTGVHQSASFIGSQVVQASWSDCWSSANGGTLGAKLDDSTLDACMTYTHTQGIRNVYADFSIAILSVNKAAGLLTLLENGMPKVNERQQRPEWSQRC